MGCDAVRVSKSSELAAALKRGLAHDGASLIEVMVDFGGAAALREEGLTEANPERSSSHPLREEWARALPE